MLARLRKWEVAEVGTAPASGVGRVGNADNYFSVLFHFSAPSELPDGAFERIESASTGPPGTPVGRNRVWGGTRGLRRRRSSPNRLRAGRGPRPATPRVCSSPASFVD